MKTVWSWIFNLVWLIIVAGFVIAFIRVNNINSAEKVYPFAKAKAAEWKACLGGVLGVSERVPCTPGLKVGGAGGDKNYYKSNFGVELESSGISTGEITGSNTENSNSGEGSSGQGSDQKTVSLDGVSPAWKKLKTSSLSKEDLIIKLDSLEQVEEYDDVPYKRGDWQHWNMLNGSSCWSIRDELLHSHIKDSLVLADRNKEDVQNKDQACSIKAGKWISPYSDIEIDGPSRMEIDHIVSLRTAAKSGGQEWDRVKKQEFANDSEVVLPVSGEDNKSKGAKTPSEWMPQNKDVHCHYAKAYTHILSKYNLKISVPDKEVLKESLANCRA